MLPVAVGTTDSQATIVIDLAAVHHVLIAGGPGSGKSTTLDSVLVSLLYSHSSDRLRLCLVDTKMLGLSPYASVHQLLLPVISDARRFERALRWLEREVERRLNEFVKAHTRSIQEYNQPRKERESISESLPHIVVAIDDLVDLTTNTDDPLPLISRLLLLMDRAWPCGIHFVCVTSHPGAPEFADLIPEAFSCRLSLWLPQLNDRRAITENWARNSFRPSENMFLISPPSNRPLAVRSAVLSSEDVERVTDWYKTTARPSTPDIAEEQSLPAYESASMSLPAIEVENGELDPLIYQAAEVCIQNQLGSTSLLQRRMSIGYGRAAKIIDELELLGILGPANGSRPRDVIIPLQDLDQTLRGRTAPGGSALSPPSQPVRLGCLGTAVLIVAVLVIA